MRTGRAGKGVGISTAVLRGQFRWIIGRWMGTRRLGWWIIWQWLGTRHRHSPVLGWGRLGEDVTRSGGSGATEARWLRGLATSLLSPPLVRSRVVPCLTPSPVCDGVPGRTMWLRSATRVST